MLSHVLLTSSHFQLIIGKFCKCYIFHFACYKVLHTFCLLILQIITKHTRILRIIVIIMCKREEHNDQASFVLAFSSQIAKLHTDLHICYIN